MLPMKWNREPTVCISTSSHDMKTTKKICSCTFVFFPFSLETGVQQQKLLFLSVFCFLVLLSAACRVVLWANCMCLCTDAPDSVEIYTIVNVEIGVQNTLICRVTGFYPAPVNVTWSKNTKKVVEGTSITVPLSNKDGSFSQTSKLDFVPKGGDLYACIVEHVALTQPVTKIYGEYIRFSLL